MSSSRKHNQRRATIFGSIIGFIIILSFTITLILPDSARRSSSSSSSSTDYEYNTPVPTAIVAPTADPDPQLEGANPFIHSSGLFSTFRPAGTDWFINESGPDDESNIARVVIQSPTRLTVIHNYIQPDVEYETLASLSENYLTAAYFNEAWQGYDQWIETGRTVNDDAVVIDFSVAAENIDYIARSITWLEDNRLFATRIVTPADNELMLDLVEAHVMTDFKAIPGTEKLPLAWLAFVDQTAGYLLKHPDSWEQVVGGVGRPVTFTAADGQSDDIIRTWSEANQPLPDGDSVVEWLAQTEPDAEILSFTSQEEDGGMRHEVAYTVVNAAGDALSGLMVLINDAAGNLYVATLQTNILDTNLITETELSANIVEAIQVVRNGFIVLPEDLHSAAE